MKYSDDPFENIPQHHIVWIQFWQTGHYSDQAPDGMSMHISKTSLYEYKEQMLIGLVASDTIPDVFIKVSGHPMQVAVTDDLYLQLMHNNGLMRMLDKQLADLINDHKIITTF